MSDDDCDSCQIDQKRDERWYHALPYCAAVLARRGMCRPVGFIYYNSPTCHNLDLDCRPALRTEGLGDTKRERERERGAAQIRVSSDCSIALFQILTRSTEFYSAL